MKPDSTPEAFKYDGKVDYYSVDMVPDQEGGTFRTLVDQLGSNITLNMITPADAEKMRQGNLRPLKKYVKLGRTGTRILTTGYLIQDRTGRKIGISESVIKEYPPFKRPRRSS